MPRRIGIAAIALLALACGGEELRAVGGDGGSGGAGGGGGMPWAGCDSCSEHATCDLSGAYPVCSCDGGFDGDGVDCADVDECTSGRCDPRAICENLPGSFTCSCPPPLQGDGTVCRESNEFQGPVVVGAIDPGSAPALAPARDDVFVAWRTGEQVKVLRWLGASDVWDRTHLLGEVRTEVAGSGPLIAAAEDGRAVVAWIDPGDAVHVISYDPVADRWSLPTLVADELAKPVLAGLAVDASGNTSLAWTSFDVESGFWLNEARAHFVGPGRWTERIYLGLSKRPTLRTASFTVEDRQVLRQRFYYEAAGERPSSMLMEFDLATGTAYQLNGQYLGSLPAIQGSGTVAYDPTGRAHVGWIVGAGDTVVMRTTNGPDAWAEAQRPRTSGYDLLFDLATAPGAAAIATSSSEGSSLHLWEEGRGWAPATWEHEATGASEGPLVGAPTIGLQRGRPLVVQAVGYDAATSLYLTELVTSPGTAPFLETRLVVPAGDEHHHVGPELAVSALGELLAWRRVGAGGTAELVVATRK